MHVQQAATLTLERLLSGKGSLATLMPDFLNKIPHSQQAKYKELCWGSCRHFYQLEQVIDQLTEKPLRPSERRIKAILIVGLYQILSMRTPNYAAVNESVDIARKLNKGWAKKLINAILREFIRSGEKLVRMNVKDEAYKHGHPEWLFGKIMHTYPNDWAKTLKANNSHPPLCLRVNLKKVKRADYLQMLSRNGIPAKTTLLSPAGVQLLRPMPVQKIPGFRDGIVTVQDEAAQLAGYFVAPQKNERGLDACAAPGGKATHLLELEPSIQLLMLDKSESRVTRLTENMTRMKAHADISVADATDIDNWWDNRRFDFILLDAPCSSSGVIRRKPDIRILLSQERVEQVRKLQLSLLEQLWHCLNDGGRLLYSTCSIFPEENKDIVESFSVRNGNVEFQEISLESECVHTQSDTGIQILPTSDGPDGFFYSLMRKV